MKHESLGIDECMRDKIISFFQEKKINPTPNTNLRNIALENTKEFFFLHELGHSVWVNASTHLINVQCFELKPETKTRIKLSS